jgi:hypothetical protein
MSPFSTVGTDATWFSSCGLLGSFLQDEKKIISSIK